MNKNGSVVYFSQNGNAFFNNSGSISSDATGDGSQTIFSVSSIPAAIYINGVYQNQNSYTIAGGNVTFSEAPPLNATIKFLI